jgi:hypothetical protein
MPHFTPSGSRLVGTLTITLTAAKRYTLEVVSMEGGLPRMAGNPRILE